MKHSIILIIILVICSCQKELSEAEKDLFVSFTTEVCDEQAEQQHFLITSKTNCSSCKNTVYDFLSYYPDPQKRLTEIIVNGVSYDSVKVATMLPNSNIVLDRSDVFSNKKYESIYRDGM